VETYINFKQKNTENVIFLSYEKLNSNPVQVLQQVLILLGWTECQSICQKAVENQEFKKVQSLAKQENPEKMGFWEDGGYQNFFRKGKINSGKEELSSQTLKIIEEKAMPIYRQAKMLEPLFTFDFSGISFSQKLASLKKDKQTKYIFYYSQAQKRYRKGELTRAIDMYSQAIELNSTSAWSHYNLAEILTKQGKIDEAITAYHQAIELKPRTASFQYKLAEALVKKGRLEEAIKHYQKASELNPDFPLFQRKLAEIIKLHQEVSERPTSK
jgi:tetratricopeptide (TPR) repeat protein